MHILTNIFKLSPNSKNTLEPIQNASTYTTQLLVAVYKKGKTTNHDKEEISQ